MSVVLLRKKILYITLAFHSFCLLRSAEVKNICRNARANKNIKSFLKKSFQRFYSPYVLVSLRVSRHN